MFEVEHGWVHSENTDTVKLFMFVKKNILEVQYAY